MVSFMVKLNLSVLFVSWLVPNASDQTKAEEEKRLLAAPVLSGEGGVWK
jgi:hypothetical protein